MIKKYTKITIVALFLAIMISGCTFPGAKTTNKPAIQGGYNYKNDDLGFSLVLPKEFEYFQTQRKNQTDYTDLEIFVPTSDIKYPQEVPGYAKPIVIRVYDKKAYDLLPANDGKIFTYPKFKEKNGKVYLIKFWGDVPADWQTKWSGTMQKNILNDIKI